MIKSYLSKFISLDALMPFMVIFLLVIIGVKLIAAKTPGFKKQQKKFSYYLLILIGIMAVIVAIVYNLRQSTVILRYYTFMSAALLMGSLHVYFYQSTFNKFETNHKFKTFLFSLVASVVLILPVIMIGAHFHDLTYLPFYFLVTAAFVIPTCFFHPL